MTTAPLRFPPPAHKARPAKAHLRAAREAKIERARDRLPVLDAQKPDAADLICDLIDDWIETPPPDDGAEQDAGGHPTVAVTLRHSRPFVVLVRDDAVTARIALALALGEDPVTWLARKACA